MQVIKYRTHSGDIATIKITDLLDFESNIELSPAEYEYVASVVLDMSYELPIGSQNKTYN
jgi:hypothetical protein